MRFFVQKEAPGRYMIQPSGWEVAWRPIAEAPKDGTWFLLRSFTVDGVERVPFVVSWRPEDGWIESFAGLQVNELFDPERSFRPSTWSPIVLDHATGVIISLPPEEELRAQRWSRAIARALLEEERSGEAKAVGDD